MGLVIKKLTHPYSLTHKDYNKKGMRLFCVGFPRERERREIFFFKKKFLRLFFLLQNFLTFILYFLTFSDSLSLSLSLSLYIYIYIYISLKTRGYSQGKVENGGLALVYQDTQVLAAHSKEYTNASLPLLPLHQLFFVFFFFLNFGPILMRLFGGLSGLCFL